MARFFGFCGPEATYGEYMSYIDAFFNKEKDIIQVVERDNKGVRRIIDYPAKYKFYIADPKGKHTSIYGDRLTRIRCKNTKEFRQELKANSNCRLFESDLDPVFSCLAENYLDTDAPEINVGFWDIETDMQPFVYSSDHVVTIRKNSIDNTLTVFELNELKDSQEYEVFDEVAKQWTSIAGCRYLMGGPGYAPTDDPFMPITAISIYLKWIGTMFTLSIPPATLSFEEASDLVKDIPNTILFQTEIAMLDAFLDIIKDCDVLSGWNDASYDVPYTVNRVAKLMGKQATKRFCLLDQFPKPKEFERFGSTTHTYQFIGRVNMDMLDLYRKYTYEEKPTYRLDYIGELEVGENKVPYDGTLDQLYRNDFLKFIEYSRQDVFLLDKLDEKLKFLSLGLTYAHENTVLLPTILGTVAATEQALINEAHGRNLVVPNKKPKAIKGELKDKAAGAYVAYPKKGIWDWVGSLDINSLYPSTICALNMSPETIVAQVRLHITNAHIEEQMTVHKKSFAKSWEGMFGCFEYDYIMEQRTDIMLYVDWEDGKSEEATPADIYSMVFDQKNKLAISANGTIFTYAKDGLVSAALTKWYIDRKKIQKTLKDVQVLEYGLELSDELYNQVKTYL